VRTFWPAAEAAQVDYEALRSAVLAGTTPMGPAASRFWRRGLAGLIGRPATAEPVFLGVLRGAARPPWTPHADPRLEVLAGSYELVLAAAGGDDAQEVAW
jgi:hypothetical protein